MSQTVAEVLALVTKKLSRRLPPKEAARDARLLMQAFAGWTGAGLTTRLRDPFCHARREDFWNAVYQRERGVSVAHITHHANFFGRAYYLSLGDLAPRPDTETLVEVCLATQFERVLDLGTGTGIIAITLLLERPGTTGVATDLSKGCLFSARINRSRHGLKDRLNLRVSDWFDGVEGQFDLIAANPPYVAEEDYAHLPEDITRCERREALTPGGDGLDAYRTICAGAPPYLSPGGRLVVEIGHDQRDAVMALFADAGLEEITCHTDINGKDRVVSGQC